MVAARTTPFSQKEFYLREFRGRSLAFALPASELARADELAPLLDELVENRIRVVLMGASAEGLAPFAGGRVLARDTPHLQAEVWRALGRHGRVGVAVTGSSAFAPACREVVLRLGVFKLVWIDPEGGLTGTGGERLSFVDQAELREGLRKKSRRLRADRQALLGEIDALLQGGVPAVNVCTLEGLADELFTYEGSGTLFTRERYVAVRRLGVDDFDAAQDLVRHGVEEGYLAPRSPDAIDDVLGQGFGAFIEGSHLAGIGALLVHEEANVGEIAALYTLTRFLGEGVGGHLVAFAVEQARARGVESVFACTTSERVGRFFQRHGFRRVRPDRIPAGKWAQYDPDRRARVRCFRRATS